ncbi:hypothetical protein ACR92V_04315, partial [Klebsiella pneumoniae]
QPATGETYPKSDLFNKAALSVREIIRTSLQPVRIGSISREKAQKTKMKLLPVTQVSGIM